MTSSRHFDSPFQASRGRRCPRIGLRRQRIFALLACLFAQSAPGQCYYTWEQIPNPGGGWFCYGEAINNHGHVAGVLRSGGDYTRGFVWSPETGTTVMPFPPGVYNIDAKDINDWGHVVGSMIGTNGQVAFLWDGVNYTIFDRPAWATGMVAASINNSDQVVGTVSNNLTGPIHAFRWERGVLGDLGDALDRPYSSATAVRSDGAVLGVAGNSYLFDTRSFVYEAGEFLWLPHPATVEVSHAVAASDGGFAAGFGFIQEPVHYFGIVWSPWATSVIPPPPGWRDLQIRAINRFGRAVGYYDRPAGPAVAWQNGVVQELPAMLIPSFPSQVKYAWDINDGGRILAKFSFGTLVLTPVRRPGDLTGDCQVGIEDLVLVLRDFGAPVGTFPMGDVDLDGDVDLADLAVLLSHWGA